MDSPVIGRLALIGGITTIAVCAIAYVVFGPSHTKKRRQKDYVPGLVNLGNWCFMNAVLQSLGPCASLKNWLSKFTNCHQSSSGGITHNSVSLSNALLKTVKVLNNEDDLTVSECSPVDVLKALRAKGWVISSDEQDAHELFHVITTTLEEEFHAQSYIKSLLDVQGLEYISDHNEGASRNACKDVAFRTQSPIKIPKYRQIIGSPTKGLLASRLTCKSCGLENPIHYDSFDSISLPIPDGYFGLLRLEDCLNHWSSSELVHGVTCENCSKLHSPAGEAVICKSTFSKQLSIAKLPDCLCFHFVRTLWLGTSGVPTKKYDHVIFPEILCMDRFLLSNKKKSDGDANPLTKGLLGGNLVKKSSSKISELLMSDHSMLPQEFNLTDLESSSSSAFGIGNHIYRLKSVIVHMGDTFSGHFVTYRKGPLNSSNASSWFYTSDTIVHQVSPLEVTKSNAYMLIYERVNCATQIPQKNILEV